MLEVTSLGSGSSGNSLLIRTSQATLLVDCGVGVRRLNTALGDLGLRVSDVNLVLISHEHGDHVRELPRFVAAGTQTVSTRGTSQASHGPAATWMACSAGKPLGVLDLEVVPIPVAHDAAEPCGFLVRTRSGNVTVLTDLGSPSGAAVEAIAESHLVVVEANHDEALLRRGPYPLRLQRRILSDTGHLSNSDCGALLTAALKQPRTFPTVWLAHLSETNNRPHLAKQTVARRLAASGLGLDIRALPRRAASETWSPGTARPGIAQLALDL